MRLSSLLLVLAACKGAPEDTEPVDTEPVEETDTEVLFENSYVGYVTEISGVPREPRSAIGLVQVDLSTGLPALGVTMASRDLAGGGTFAIGLADDGPPADQIGPVLAHAGLEGAWYVPVTFVDEDYDGLLDAGEIISGVNLDLWLGWHQGTLPSGWAAGWTLLTVDLAAPTSDPAFRPIGTEAEIALRGGPSLVELEGEWADAPAGAGVVVLDDAVATGGTPSASHPMDRLISDDAYDVDIEARPGGDHFDTSNPDLWYAAELLLAYTDTNGSGKYDHGVDALTGAGVCWNGKPISLRYIAPPTTLATAIELERRGWAAGWRAIQTDGDAIVELSSAETEYTTVDPSACPAPF